MGEILLTKGDDLNQDEYLIKINTLCQLLRTKPNDYSDIRCIEEFGFIIFKQGEKKIIISKFGRITVQRAHDKKDLLDTIEQLIQFLAENNIF